METVIRPFTPHDEVAVIALWDRCGLLWPANDPHEDIARKMKVNPELFLVAHTEGQLVGTVMAGYEGHRGWINYLAADPSHQRGGLGRRLMAEAEARLKALGCPKVNLQVRTTNQAVRDFYQRLGYRKDEVISFGKRLIEDN
jgi:ribosomal protein S18 acetylase RimI-like enzyme